MNQDLFIYSHEDMCIYRYIWKPFLNRFPQDKQELLRQFVMNEENLDKVETHLTVSREQEGEVEHKKELLTIAEMKRRNFSE